MPLRAPLSRRPGACDARPEPIERTLGPLCVGAGLITDASEVGHALLEHRIGDVGDAVLDRAVDSIEGRRVSRPSEARERVRAAAAEAARRRSVTDLQNLRSMELGDRSRSVTKRSRARLRRPVAATFSR